MQRAQAEWDSSYDWEENRTFFYPNITSATTATISLPTDWRKVAAPPVNWSQNNSNGVGWPEILPEQRLLYSIQDRYYYILGNQNAGFSMIWNPGTLNSGTSLEIQYFATPASLASAGQIPTCPDSQYLADRTIAYILEARYDNRYQSIEVKARERLLQMISMEDVKKYSSYANPNLLITPERRQAFRIGRD